MDRFNVLINRAAASDLRLRLWGERREGGPDCERRAYSALRDLERLRCRALW